MSGNTVSKSKNHQRRTWKPNLVEVKTEIEGTTENSENEGAFT